MRLNDLVERKRPVHDRSELSLSSRCQSYRE